MKYTIEQLKGEVKINFSLTAEEWDKYLEKSYLKNKGKFNIPGFRKGRATRKMIEKMYGEGVFFDDAFNFAFYESYAKALDENAEIFPVEDPRVDIDAVDENGVKFNAIVTVKPEVTLGAYTGIKLDKVEYNVTAEDVQAEIDRTRKQSARRIEVADRAVANGDIVNLDYSGSVDGVKFNGGTATGQELVIGSGSFIPGFEEQMVGMAIGETKDINVTFPEEYHAEELKGKAAVFTVTVNKIEAEELPALDDEFAKNVSRFDTFEEYKTDIETRLKENKERQANNENENNLISAVSANATVDIPACMIEQQIDYLLEDMQYRLNYMYRMKLEDYLKYTGGSMEELRKSRAEEAERDVKTRLVLEAIIKAENLDVTEDEVIAEIERMATAQGKTVEDYRKHMESKQVNYIKNDLVTKKLIAFLKENNTFSVAEKKEVKAKKTSTKKTTEKSETAKKTTAKKSTKKAEKKED